MPNSRAGLGQTISLALIAAVLLVLFSQMAAAAPIRTFEARSVQKVMDGGAISVPNMHAMVAPSLGSYQASSAAAETVVLVRRKSIAAKIRDAFHKVGHAIKHAFQKVGQGIKKVAQKVGQGIKKVAKKVGSGIKKAAQKVGHFIKTTGAKIAKVALKVVATAQKLASKVVGWIPGVGKPLSRIMSAESTGLSKASDAIHVKLGGKLDKAMHKMDKVQKIAGYIPRELPEEATQNAFHEWDEDDYDMF